MTIKQVAVFNTQTGEPIAIIRGTQTVIDANLAAGQDFVDCALDDALELQNYYVDLGNLKLTKKPPCPSPNHVWKWSTRSWKTDLDHGAQVARAQRDQLLRDSDWSQGHDVPETIKRPWAAYRQALRDLTAQADFPANIVWPTAP